MSNTKIVATIGPASNSYESIKNLLLEGVNVFRMNFSHGDYDFHLNTLNNIRKASKETNLIAGSLVDVCGPKIRVGELKENFNLKKDDILNIYKDEILGYKDENGEYNISMNQPSILSKLTVGNELFLYDGLIHSIVTSIKGDKVVTKLLNDGVLSSRKGINFPNTRLNLNVITEKDKKDIAWAVEHNVEYIAISFVQSENDVKQAKKIVETLGGECSIISKIEKFDALERIDAILEESYGIMIARGDLGIEIPYYKVPFVQKEIIKKANTLGKPVITATQMLLSMTEKENPTRAEVSDVANAVMDGTDAVMLSEESAVGHNPVLVVSTMKNIITEVENSYSFYEKNIIPTETEADIISHSSVRLARKLDAKAIIAITSSGTSVRNIAKYRPLRPIIAVSHNPKTLCKLTLSWGVKPVFTIEKGKIEEMIRTTLKRGIDKHILYSDKTYVINAGYPSGISGTTNMINILKPEVMKYYIDNK